MPTVTVLYRPQTDKVEFAPDNGKVIMRARGDITFQHGGNVPFDFESFGLNPEDRTQFPRVVTAAQITVDDLFTDAVEKSYKYTVVIKLSNGTTKVGDPQIINQPV